MRQHTRVKLSHKLMGLVIIPLVFEIVFFCVLTSLLKQTEQEAIREGHAKIVIATCNELPNLIFDAGTSLAGFCFTRNDELRQKYFELIDRIEKQLRTVEILTTEDPNQVDAFIKVQESCFKGLESLESYRKQAGQVPELSSIATAAQWRGNMQFTVDSIMSGIQELVKEQRRISDASPLTQSSLRGQILYALAGGIVFNIILAIVLTLLLYKEIVTRIDVVVRNTKKIVKREELLPRVRGSDEISLLDSVFHDMADELDRVAKHKRELISMVSHDLRSPLMSVQVSLELIASGAIGELQARVGKEVGVASRNVKRLIELINDLLDIEKMEAGRLEMHVTRQEILPLISSALDSVQAAADKKGITIQKPFFDVLVDADRQRLVQVFVNLLSNSIKYSPDDSEIGIEVEDLEPEVLVRIRDEGPGIPPNLTEKIFERFQQVDSSEGRKETDRAKKGTGLGLAICKAIIAGHDGNIGVESELGKGSVFWFTLPKREGDL